MNKRSILTVSLVCLIFVTSFSVTAQEGEWLPVNPTEELESGDHSWYIQGLYYPQGGESWIDFEFTALVYAQRAIREQFYLDETWDYQFFVYLYLSWITQDG